MVLGQNVSGQNVTDKMSLTKCYVDKISLDKMSRTKCRGKNVGDKMSWSLCSGQNVLVKMSRVLSYIKWADSCNSCSTKTDISVSFLCIKNTYYISKHCWNELLFRTRIVHKEQGSLLAFIRKNRRGKEMGHEVLYDDLHGFYGYC